MSMVSTLDRDSLEFFAFDLVRRVGVGKADGMTIRHGGEEYGLTVGQPCLIEVTHITFDQLSGEGPPNQTAMAVVRIRAEKDGDVDGLGLVMNALVHGHVIAEGHPTLHRVWRVLAGLPVPLRYQMPADGGHDEGCWPWRRVGG